MVLSETLLQKARVALVSRIDTVVTETGERFPYVVDDDGTWDTTADGNWCGGHWIGLLWFARSVAANLDDDRFDADRFDAAARSHTETLIEYMPRDSMFCGLNFYIAGFRGYDYTGDRRLFGLGLSGADAMCDLYDEKARQIPLGRLAIKGPEQFRGPESDHGPSGDRIGAVDNIYTALPVLWRAFIETTDPQFRDTAISHADRHLDWYLRADGRTWHHAVFDRDDGSLERQYNELAAGQDGCWARGQGWSVAGLARTYAETRSDRFLEALQRTVDYYRRKSPANDVPFWDLEVVADDETPRDTSAAALVAYGLVLLPETEATVALRTYGQEILETLITTYLVTDPKADAYGAVTHGCFNKPGEYATDTELIWTNYYVARAVEHLYDV